MPVAIVTGASRGLGRALSESLAERGWSLVVSARGTGALADAADDLRERVRDGATVVAVAGDVAHPGHRSELIRAATHLGELDLLVNNASTLGPSPLPDLASYRLDDLRYVYEVNTFAPLALVQAALPLLVRSDDPRILDITSDAASEAYEGWGGYGSSKAALEQLGAVLAAELPSVRVWTVDPGDMRTQMHQDAFPGEDISDRPPPESVVPGLVGLIEGRLGSGRYRAAEIHTVGGPAK
jgi:NAD(P)-dependent dehydrogenase (short-subunit alcohol dehydrogenase family)